MISIYTGMDMNFTQPFTTTPHGLSKTRFPSFNPQDTFHQPQQPQQPQQSTFTLINGQNVNNNMSVSTVVPLVEPMVQSHLSSSSSSSSLSLPISSSPSSTYQQQQQQQNNMYYHPYPSSTYVSDSTNTSVTSSPSMDDSWKYTSTELFPESSLLSSSSSSSTSTSNSPSSHSHYITTTSTPSTSSAFLYPHHQPQPQSQPQPQPQQQQQQQQQDDYYTPSYSSCTTSPSISHSPSLNIYDPLPSFQISTATSPSFISYQHSPPICSVPSPPQSTMTIIPTSISTSSLSSSSNSTNHPHHYNTQSQHKKKRTSSSSPSPLIYSRHSRTSSSSSSSTSSTSQQQQQHHHHHPYSQKSNTSSSSSSSSEYHHGGSSSFSSFISRKMISSFPTKHDATSGTSKRYECHICSKKFTRPSSLTTHIYSHTGEKPFKCPVEGCGRHFSVVSNLRRHAKIHSNPGNNSSKS